MTRRSARLHSAASALMRFHAAVSASFIAAPETPLYFASMAALSNSGSLSSQTFRTSSLISGRTFLEAARKALVSAIEFDLSPRGDDCICRTFILVTHLPSPLIAGITFDANSSRCRCAQLGGNPGGSVHE